jgi:hypothetical protein
MANGPSAAGERSQHHERHSAAAPAVTRPRERDLIQPLSATLSIRPRNLVSLSEHKEPIPPSFNEEIVEV